MKLYGLGDVLTLPEFRRKGYGSYLVHETTNFILHDRTAELALLLTKRPLGRMYAQHGWEHILELRVETGEYQDQSDAGVFPMVLLISSNAKDLRTNFHQTPLVLSGCEW